MGEVNPVKRGRKIRVSQEKWQNWMIEKLKKKAKVADKDKEDEEMIEEGIVD